MRLVRFAIATALILSTPLAVGNAGAQDLLTPIDVCYGVEHFPDDPIDDAPSKARIGITLNLEYGGSQLNLGIEGASGVQTGTGIVGADGLGFVEVPLYQYGEHSIVNFTLTMGDMDPYNVGFSDIGDGGLFVVNDAQPSCDATTLSPAPPPSTTTTTTTTTSAPAETTAAPATTTPVETTQPATTTEAPTTTAAPDSEESGGLPWPGILIGGGIIVAAGGAIAAFGGKENCDRERENLAAAQHHLEMIYETLEQALEDLKEHESEITTYETELESFRKSKSRGSSTENKVKYFAHDGERLSEGEIDAHVEYYEGMLKIAREAAARDEARVREWHEKFEHAQREVSEAEAALAKCRGESEAPPPGPQHPEISGPSAPAGTGGPAVATPPPTEEILEKPDCEDGAVYIKKLPGRPDILRQVVDFAVIAEIMEGTQRKVGEANAMSLGLSEAAAGLDLLGKALGARGAGQSIAKGIGGMSSGKYVMGAGGLAKGTAEGAMASGETKISIPTSPPEAVVEVVKGAANLGAFVSRKVGEWLKANQVYNVRLTLFQQTITATPYELWRCVEGSWKCEKVWEYDVGPLRKHGTTNPRVFRLNTKENRHRMNTEVGRLGQRAQSEIARSLQARADFDAKHQPSSCG